jgi:hypothetical protein
MGIVAPGHTIGISARAPVDGELVVQASVDQQFVVALFPHLKLAAGKRETISVQMSGTTPVVHLLIGSRDEVAPREAVAQLPAFPTPTGPHTQDQFVDCSRIGGIVTVHDPRQDVALNVNPDAMLADDSADLLSVSVARSSSQLCADFRLAGPPSQHLSVHLALHQQATTELGLVNIEARLDPAGDQLVICCGSGSAAGEAAVPGAIGIHGHELSLLVSRTSCQLPLPTPHFSSTPPASWYSAQTSRRPIATATPSSAPPTPKARPSISQTAL